ncbi:MAG: ribose 5-phosphate isomerase B [Firmicutes bacterium]|nr:ribose 5-phosphate isomerase B [Bacillota bacterium]
MIAIASDHGGFDLKEAVRKHLEEKGITCRDFGTDSKASCDYPDYAGAAAKAVADGECEKGIVICTTGIGVSIVANKVNGIRCGLCTNVTQARLTREHNNANMLALGAGITGQTAAMDIVDTFLSTEFSHGERHERRVRKIAEYEE